MKKTISYLFYFKALVWITLAFFYLSRHLSPNENVVYWVVAGLLFVNSISYAVLGYLLKQNFRWVFWLSLVLVAGNILLTITDQVGWVDWMSLATDLALVVLLLWYRKEWLSSKRG